MATKKRLQGNNGLDANNQTISNVATPSASSDASTKGYADTLVPSQAGNTGKYLTTNGSATSWATVTASASAESLTGTTIASTVTGSSLTSVGTITTGTWNASAIGVAYGGTGLTTLTAGYIPYGNGTSAFGSSANLFWDSANSRLGVGTASPAKKLDISVNVNSGDGVRITNTNTGSSAGASSFYSNGTHTHEIGIVSTNYGGYGALTASNFYLYAGGNNSLSLLADGTGVIKFGTGSGVPERMRLDSSGNLGLSTNGTSFQWINSGNNVAINATSGVLSFYTGTAAYNLRATLDSSGNLGLGTSSPATKLDVNGGDLLVDAASVGDERGIFFRRGFTSTDKYNVSILVKDHDGNFPDGLSINAYDGISFCTGSNTRNERMRLNVNGNLGLSTTNPVYKMQIEPTTVTAGGVNNLLRIGTQSTTTGTTSRFSMFCSTDPVNDTNGGKVFIDAIRTATNMDLAFSLNNTGGAAPVERMRLTGEGNLGIGKTPSYKLDVNGTVNGSAFYSNGYIVADQASAYIKLYRQDGGIGIFLGGSGDQANYYDNSSHIFRNTSGGEWARLNSTGLGIGTNSPAYKLDVNGTGYFSGGTNSIIAQDDGGAGAWRGRILSKNATYDRASFLGNYNGVAGVFAHNNALNAWVDLYVNTTDGSGGGTVRMPSSVLINGSQAIHAGNYSSYAIPVSGGINMSGGYGLNDQKLFLRTNGDANHYLWNANDDWEELVAYAGTGFRVASSTGASLMTFTTSAVNSGVALQQGGNQVLHAGNANTYCPTRFTTTIDASALNQSTFYPVIMFPNNGRQLKVRVKNVLNSNVPSWSTHASGFTFVLDYEVNGHGWGTVVINRKIFNYSEGYTSARICGGIGQLGNGSAEYVMVRGGGIYYFEVDDSSCTPALYSSGYSYAGQSINPTTSTINDIWNSAAGTYLGVQAIYLPSYDGIYTQNNNGASFRPNDGTYGSWKVSGNRNGWCGLEFDSTTNGTVSLMVYSGSLETGFYNNTHGWQFRWNQGTLYCHKGTYGGGTIATVLDSSNYSSYAIPNSGSWFGDLGSYGFTRYAGMDMPSGSEVVFLYKGGQGYTLVDGSYLAFEGGGFYSSFNSSGGTLLGMRASATNTLELNARTVITRSVQGSGGDDFFMELFAPNSGSSGGDISLRFHQGSQWWRQIRANNDGFRFTLGNTNDTVPITASNVIAQNEVSATNGMTHYGGNRIPRTIVSTSTPSGTITDGDVWLQY